MFRLACFVGSGTAPSTWNKPWSGADGDDWADPGFLIGIGQMLERACFDYMMIEDGSFVTDAWKGTPDYAFRNAWAVPKNDPMPYVPLIAQATKHIGIVATITTTFYPPFIAARLGATLDHLTGGRVGFNLVTAHNDRTAQNFGLPQMTEHGLRYRMAAEWVAVADALWNSWEPDAIRNDRESGIFIDPAKVHPIEFEGEFFRCRGPLNTAPGPQRRPVLCQAGASGPGIEFAAARADTVIAIVPTIEAARNYRRAMTEALVANGRAPDAVKMFFAISLAIGETEEEAQAKRERLDEKSRAAVETSLFDMSFASGIDLSKFDLDQPLPALETNASKSITARLNQPGKTLREIASTRHGRGIPFTGTADGIAAQMGEVIEEIGGDGYLLDETLTRRNLAEVADGLTPALQRRGLIRRCYPHKTFRENLHSF